MLALSALDGALLLLTVLWIFRIAYSYSHLKRIRDNHAKNTAINTSHLPIRIILPVLSEEQRLEEFVSYFINTLLKESSTLELWIVTTERELKEYPKSTTIKLAKDFADSHSAVHHIHYPNTNGVMAHQLNYAIKTMPKDGIYAIYNADSRPEPKTFSWIDQHNDNTNQMIFQQYGVYTKNYSYIKTRTMRSLLISNMYWQTRWAIGFEYYRAISAITRISWPVSLRAFNYCIGHGLFISAELIKDIKFSEITTNEDAILGLEVALRGIAVQPVPYFDLSESPDSVSSIYHQKTNWYQGPLQSPIYYKILRARYPAINRSFIALMSAKLFTHAIYWIVGPIVVVYCFVAALMLSVTHPYSSLFILAPIAFLILPALLVNSSLKRLRVDGYPPSQNKQYTFRLIVNLIVGVIPSYFVHGLAGLRGLILSNKILHGTKMKTSMVQYKES